jgi:putative nucleotidyltransferase with HDIG domain
VDAATVLLRDPHANSLDFAAGRGFWTVALKHTHLRIGEGHAGRAALERVLVIVSDLAQDLEFQRSRHLGDEQFVSYLGVPLVVKGEVRGVLEIFHRTPLTPTAEWLEFLTTLAGQAAIAIDNATLFADLQRSNMNLKVAYDTTLEGWSRALDLRDRETEGHTKRVAEVTVRLAREVGMNETELVQVRRGALLHDIGKMAVPDAILHKPGPLTTEEWEIMRRHPGQAHDLLWPIEYLRPALDIPWCHHEKWDGSGYPRGLTGEQIPLAARVFAVVDVWDALRSDRPYRLGWHDDQVREYLRAQSGSHFDPYAVDQFLNIIY